MAFKDVLVSLTTYPDPMPVSAVGHAVALAVALGARISAVACGVKVPVPGSVLAGVLLDVAAMAAPRREKVRPTPKISWTHSKPPRKRAECSNRRYLSNV